MYNNAYCSKTIEPALRAAGKAVITMEEIRMAQIAIDRAAPAHVYCCAQRGQVYMSHDSGQTWRKTQVPVEMSRSRHIYPMVCG